MRALRGEVPDRPPLAHVAALTTVELQQATGCFMPEVHLDAAQLVELLGANHAVLGFDAVTFIINYFNEPAALGVEMDWGAPDVLPMYASHPWKRPEDMRLPGDVLERAPVSTYLEALYRAKRDYGDTIAVLGKVMGPFSMVQVMCGVENIMMALIEAPDKVRRFLDLAVEVLVTCGNAQFERGIDALAIGEGGAGANMLSPEMYETILLPVHQRMIGALEGPTIMHMCGDITPRLDMLARTGLTCFNFDWAIPPKVMAEAAGGKFTIMGNVNTADLLNAGPEEIERQAVENIAAGVHIISPGCAVSPRCPNANFQAMARACEKARTTREQR